MLQRLASLGTAFSQNVLADEKSWEMALAPEDLVGLPDFLVAAMAEAAGSGATADSGYPVAQPDRAVPAILRPARPAERAFRAWVARGANGGETDNRAIVAETLRLREERARLLGYANFAAFKLENEMAKTPEAVRELLMAVWGRRGAQAEADAARLGS